MPCFHLDPDFFAYSFFRSCSDVRPQISLLSPLFNFPLFQVPSSYFISLFFYPCLGCSVLSSFLHSLIFPLCFRVSSFSFVSSFLSPYTSSSPVFLVPSLFRFFPASCLPPALCNFSLRPGGNFTNDNRLTPVRKAVHIVPYLKTHLIFSGIISWASWSLKICCPESSYAATNIRCLLFQKNKVLALNYFCEL